MRASRSLRQLTTIHGGFSLIELLVAVGVVGLLVALAVPAVQMARGAARRMQCQNNLRQVGVAVHNLQQETGSFPTLLYPRDLLPHLEMGSVAEKLPDIGMSFELMEQFSDKRDLFACAFAPVFACPSDPAQTVVNGRALNYLMNGGSAFGDGNHGFFDSEGGVSPPDVTDGLSQTFIFCEKLLMRGTLRTPRSAYVPTEDERLREFATTDPYYDFSQLEVFAQECSDDAVWFSGVSPKYASWGTVLHSLTYNHISTPNQPSCFNGPLSSTDNRPERYAAVTATSLHPGGTNGLLADGSVRFVSESIDGKLWWGLGTRNGNEAVSF